MGNNTSKSEEYSYKLFRTKNLEEVIRETKDIVHTKVCRCKGVGEKESLIYQCETCGIRANSCICADCFKPEDHIGHKYYVNTADTFVCQCGDETAWRNPCPKHGHKLEKDPFALLPEKYKKSFIKEFPNVMNFVYESYKNNGKKAIEEIFLFVNEMMKSDLLNLCTAKFLSTHQIPNSWKSKLKDIGHSNVCYFQWI